MSFIILINHNISSVNECNNNTHILGIRIVSNSLGYARICLVKHEQFESNLIESSHILNCNPIKIKKEALNNDETKYYINMNYDNT